MMDYATYLGGSQLVSSGGTTTLARNSKRVVHCEAASAITLVLPSQADIRANECDLGMRHVVLNKGSANVVVKLPGGSTTLATLTPGEAARLYMTSSTWIARKTTIGAGRTHGTSTRPSVANAAPKHAYDPDCTEGSDCEVAADSGNAPLDGRDGRPLVIAPMFQNPCVAASNEWREAIRASDVVMPSVIPIRLKASQFVADSTHPLASTALSQKFYDTFSNNGRPHVLTYLGSAHGTSRLWFHARYVPGAIPSPHWDWKSPSLSVKRHVWEKQVDYEPVEGSGTTRKFRIRFVMEHTCDPEPQLEPESGDGVCDPLYGAWGAVFMVYVMTDELLPTFVDGGTFTPAHAAGPIAFSLADPAAWGGIIAGETEAEKFMHPHMVCCAALPTTMHAPCGRNWVPILDAATVYSGQRGRNREVCYQVGNGSPWVANNSSPHNAIGPYLGRALNIVFGGKDFEVFGCMSTGGDVPYSKPTEWLVWENAETTGSTANRGNTYLRPLHGGWDERTGELTVGSNSGSIAICIGPGDCADPDDCDCFPRSCGQDWPGFRVNPCDGHPAEPMGYPSSGAGGTHRCFNRGNVSTPCCVKIEPGLIKTESRCIQTWTTYDASCSPVDLGCINLAVYRFQIAVPIESYVYYGDPTSRVVTWKQVAHDPTQVFLNFTFVAGAGAWTDWTTRRGSWTLNTSSGLATVTAAGGTAPVRALTTYEPASFDYRDVIVRATARKCKTIGAQLAVRGQIDGSGRFTGIIASIVPIVGTTATVIVQRVVLDAATTLATTAIGNNDENCELELEVWGSSVMFRWKPGSDPQQSITATDCVLLNGGLAGLGCPVSTTGAQYDEVEIEDRAYQYVEAAASLNNTTVSASCDDKLNPGHGRCTESNGCSCLCRSWANSRQFSSATSYPGVGQPADYTTTINPTWPGRGMPDPTCKQEFICGVTRSSGCSDCPPPFPGITFVAPAGCASEASGENAKICLGIENWVITYIVCF